MLIPLDLRTLNVLLVVALLSLAPILAAAWLGDRRQNDVRMVAAAFVSLGISYLLGALHDRVPVSSGIADLIGCVGFLLLWQAAGLRARRSHPSADLGILATTAGLALYVLIWPDASSRVIVTSSFKIIVAILAVRDLMRTPGAVLHGHGAIAVLVFVGLGLLMSARTVEAAIQYWVSDLSDNARAESIEALVLLISAGLYVALACDTLRSSLARVNDALKSRNAELEVAMHDADRVNRTKSVFLASVSHDIRTPVNAALGFADLLLDSNLTKVQRQHLTMLRDAESSTLALIDDLLDLARLEIGELRFTLVPTELTALIQEVIEMLRPAATSKGLGLHAEMPAGLPPWIEVDPTRLRQVLVNLVHNAIKFTDHGEIVVAVSGAGDAGRATLRFEVRDTGIGISSDQQERLFAEFSQIAEPVDHRHGGAGLGLAICKRIVEAFGGTIGVRSTVRAGSTFWFTIDVAEAVPSAVVAEPAPSGEGRKLKVLLVEDSIANQVVIDAMLRREGHDVVVVGTGKAALEAVQRNALDLVLMDIDMPEMDGVAASSAIREFSGSVRRIPIVALTAYDAQTVKARCPPTVINDYLRKPIDRRSLRVAIAKACQAEFDQPRLVRASVIPPALDLATLASLEDQIGSSNLLGLVRTLYLQLADVGLTMEATTGRDGMAREVHKLSSVTGYLGCVELTRRCRELGDAIRDKEPRLAPYIAEIKAAAHHTCAALALRYPELAAPSPLDLAS